jgi:hypothetical protein
MPDPTPDPTPTFTTIDFHVSDGRAIRVDAARFWGTFAAHLTTAFDLPRESSLDCASYYADRITRILGATLDSLAS